MPLAMAERESLKSCTYSPIIERMIANTTETPIVDETNVYQEAKPANKPYLKEIMDDVMLPGSRVIGREHLLELHELAQRKKHCLILLEHYSNFDLPCFVELVERCGEEYQRAAQSIVAVAGVKLNAESKLVLAFTEIFTRVVLYPPRGITSILDPRQRHDADMRRARTNLAAMKMLNTLRKEGRMVLLFPTGTRYRPWDPATARGLKETDTYLKFYTHMVLVSINGNCLLPNKAGPMDEDFPVKDVMIYTVSPVIRCSEFRRKALKNRQDDEDAKQHVADSVMAALKRLHDRTEKARQRLLAEQGLGQPGANA
jgi:glycerol-3-phosphate O-acyltransferase